MNVVDSSGWIEYFGDGEGSGFFLPPIQNAAKLLVPSIVLFEVHKRMLRLAGEAKAYEIAATMSNQGRVIDLDATLALQAARISGEHGVAMADSIIYATAVMHKATLWTQDADLKDLPGVKYREKKPR